MELSFSELRAKEVVNTQDGKKLGKVCDVALCYPDNKWIGIMVPGGRNFGFSKKDDLFIELRNIVKIGEDVVLVNIGMPRKQNVGKRGHGTPVSSSAPISGGGYGGGNGVGFGGGYTNGYGAPNRNYEEFE